MFFVLAQKASEEKEKEEDEEEEEEEEDRWGTEKVRWKKILKGYGPPFCFL